LNHSGFFNYNFSLIANTLHAELVSASLTDPESSYDMMTQEDDRIKRPHDQLIGTIFIPIPILYISIRWSLMFTPFFELCGSSQILSISISF